MAIHRNNLSTLSPFRMHASCHYMPFKKEAAYSAGRFLEAIRRNSPRRGILLSPSRDLPSPKIIAQEECEAFARYVAAMRRKSCNRISFPSYAAKSIKRRLCYVRALEQCKIKCMSYFYTRNSHRGLVNSGYR